MWQDGWRYHILLLLHLPFQLHVHANHPTMLCKCPYHADIRCRSLVSHQTGLLWIQASQLLLLTGSFLSDPRWSQLDPWRNGTFIIHSMKKKKWPDSAQKIFELTKSFLTVIKESTNRRGWELRWCCEQAAAPHWRLCLILYDFTIWIRNYFNRSGQTERGDYWIICFIVFTDHPSKRAEVIYLKVIGATIN